MAFNGRSPAEYVAQLTEQGVETSAGRVRITSYVSTARRSPHAAAVRMFFDELMAGEVGERERGARHARRPASESPIAEVRDLAELRHRIRARGGPERESNWRRVFSGQGTMENIADVMNFILDHDTYLVSLPGSPLAPYFAGARGVQALQRMVDDEVFGLDCLGYTGTYLVYCGMVDRYPEYTQARYKSNLRFAPVARVDEVEARSVVLWLTTDPQHCAYVDRVTGGPERGVITLDLCQSSRGGPQINIGVELRRSRAATADEPARFQISGGTPEIPVPGTAVEVGTRVRW